MQRRLTCRCFKAWSEHGRYAAERPLTSEKSLDTGSPTKQLSVHHDVFTSPREAAPTLHLLAAPLRPLNKAIDQTCSCRSSLPLLDLAPPPAARVSRVESTPSLVDLTAYATLRLPIALPHERAQPAAAASAHSNQAPRQANEKPAQHLHGSELAASRPVPPSPAQRSRRASEAPTFGSFSSLEWAKRAQMRCLRSQVPRRLGRGYDTGLPHRGPGQ